MNRQEYAEYEERVAFYLNGIEHVSTGPTSHCKECCRDLDIEEGSEEELNNEPWFSWSPCEICNRPEGGNREAWHGIVAETGELMHGSCCEDCAYYLVMGRLDDTTMDEIERG